MYIGVRVCVCSTGRMPIYAKKTAKQNETTKKNKPSKRHDQFNRLCGLFLDGLQFIQSVFGSNWVFSFLIW